MHIRRTRSTAGWFTVTGGEAESAFYRSQEGSTWAGRRESLEVLFELLQFFSMKWEARTSTENGDRREGVGGLRGERSM